MEDEAGLAVADGDVGFAIGDEFAVSREHDGHLREEVGVAYAHRDAQGDY